VVQHVLPKKLLKLQGFLHITKPVHGIFLFAWYWVKNAGFLKNVLQIKTPNFRAIPLVL